MRRIDSRTRRLVRALKNEAVCPPRRHSAALERALDAAEAIAFLGPEGLERYLADVEATA